MSTSASWKDTAKAFGVKLILIDVDEQGPPMRDPDVDFKLHDTLKDALDAYPDATVVWMTDLVEDYTTLKEFVHPEGDVLYVIGSDYGFIREENIEASGRPGPAVKIDLPMWLWAQQVYAILLYDIKTKGG